jgi:hypothetical protein
MAGIDESSAFQADPSSYWVTKMTFGVAEGDSDWVGNDTDEGKGVKISFFGLGESMSDDGASQTSGGGVVVSTGNVDTTGSGDAGTDLETCGAGSDDDSASCRVAVAQLAVQSLRWSTEPALVLVPDGYEEGLRATLKSLGYELVWSTHHAHHRYDYDDPVVNRRVLAYAPAGAQ